MAARQIDLKPAGFSAVTCKGYLAGFGYLDRKKCWFRPGRRRIRKPGFLQPVEYLIGIHIVPARNLRN